MSPTKPRSQIRLAAHRKSAGLSRPHVQLHSRGSRRPSASSYLRDYAILGREMHTVNKKRKGSERVTAEMLAGNAIILFVNLACLFTAHLCLNPGCAALGV